MAVNSRFAKYLLPVLDALRDLGGSAQPVEVYEWVARKLEVTDEELAVQNVGGNSRFENDVAWARFYLVRTGYVDSSRRGVWSLTELGRLTTMLGDDDLREIIRKSQGSVRNKRAVSAVEADRVASEMAERSSPEPVVTDHRQSALQALQGLPAAGFERFCQRMLREAGFQQIRVTGRSGDGGIDGIGVLQVNEFVSFKVIFQCKRYVGAVSSPQVRDFRGAMMGRADKGLVLTTGVFTSDARQEAVRDGVPPIELVDGDGLVALMERLELGLTPRKTFEVDRGFFTEFNE